MAVALIAALAVSGLLPAKQSPQGPNEDGTAPALVKIAGEAMLESHAFEYLTELSDDVGSRITGSPEDRRAIDWGSAKMRAIGLENVHTEKFSMWRGWTRGYAKAELTSPIRRPLHVDAMGWTGSTPAGGVEAEVVAANNFDLDTEIKNINRLKGKVVLIISQGTPAKSGDMIFVQFGDFLRAAAKAGAVAVIGGQGGFASGGMNLTHTGILGFAADFSLPVLPITAEHLLRLERDLSAGRAVRMHLNVQNTFSGGPAESANVDG